MSHHDPLPGATSDNEALDALYEAARLYEEYLRLTSYGQFLDPHHMVPVWPHRPDLPLSLVIERNK
ncbi:MAG: hypothetical protein V3U27_15675 [Candidatus Tectomicrobia bacterium]